MNTILTLGSLTGIRNSNSLEDNSNIKYDHIITNPPFGKHTNYKPLMESGEYKDPTLKPLKKGERRIIENGINLLRMMEMYPVNTNKEELLFLHHCITKLAIDGLCNIVVPNGVATTCSKMFIETRKRLIETCKLRAVLDVPNGAFTHAGVATKILFFTKHENQFTDEVKFYETDKTCINYKYQGSVTLEELRENKYVLEYKRYKIINSITYKTKVELKTLDEICEIATKKRDRLAKDGKETGKYRFYSCAVNHKYIDECDYKEPHIIINGGGNAMVRIDDEFSKTNDIKALKVKEDIQIDINYVYYYLFANIDQISDIMTGATIKHINVDSLLSMEIPIPDVAKQQQIINQCDRLTQLINNLNDEKESIREIMNHYTDMHVKQLFNINDNKDDNKDVKNLGDVCEIKNGQIITKENFIDGPYPVIGGGKSPIGFHNVFNMNENTILCSSSGSAGYISLYESKVWASDCMGIIPNYELLLNQYVYYYLKTIQNDIYHLQTGAGQPHVYKTDLVDLKIYVPSKEEQEKIIKEYEEHQQELNRFQELINQIDAKIEYLKQYMKKIFMLV